MHPKQRSLLCGTALLLSLVTARAEDVPLDFAPSANMGFKDEVAGDGQGGWADQGAENDFASFDIAKKDFGGVPFRIVDPAANQGKAILTFRGAGLSGKIDLREASLKPIKTDAAAVSTSARYLYVLHTLCYATPAANDPVGTIVVKLKNGETKEFPVLTKRDVADWWYPPALPNGAVAYTRVNGNATVGVYLSQFKISDTPQEVESVTFRTAGRSVWIVVGATLSTELHALPLEKHVTIEESPEWKAADMADIEVKPDTALDLSKAIPTEPVGTYGRVIVNKAGDFAFEGKPDANLVFWPTSSFFANPGTPKAALGGKAEVRRFAEAIRRQGYNMVRLHFLDYYLMADAKADFEFNEERLDLFDYYIACLKENGIYACMDGMSTDSGFKKGSGWDYKGSSLKKDLVATAEGRDHYRTGVAKLLTHLNPYTHTRLVDDPIIAVVNFFNELEFYSFAHGLPASMQGEWQAWLRQRYHDDPAALAKAWGPGSPARFRAGMTFEEIPLFDTAAQWGSDAYGVDAGLFLVSVEARMNGWFEKTLRDIGYRGLITGWDMGKQYRNVVSRDAFPVVTMHNYYAHPSDFIKAGSHVEQASSIATAGQYWRAFAGTRFVDRPFLITEYGHVFWSGSRYEEGLLFGGYSALQGFQGVMAHCASVALRKIPRIVPFDAGADPVARANQVMTAFLLGRGDVSRSRRTVELHFDDRYLDGGGMNLSAGPGTLMSLICRFGVWYDGPTMRAYGDKPKPIAVLNASGGSRVSMTANTMDVVEKGGADEKAASLVAALKKQGLLPKDNLSDPARGIFQSDTGELLMETKNDTLTVLTPRFEGIATDKPERRSLGTVTGVESSVPSSVAVISLDGLPLARSGRMLFIYNTDALNSGMELSEDHGTLFSIGKGPTLIRTGVVKIALRNEGAAHLRAWALGFDGQRREKLPCVVENGELRLVVDTGLLQKGPTPFFEIAAQ